MQYVHKLFDEIYYWSNNKYTDDISISELLAYLKYKLKDNGEIDYFFNKSNEKLIFDLKILLKFLVDELKDFHITFFDGTNVFNFYKTIKFWKYITNNNIDIFDETTAMFKLSIVINKKNINPPLIIPEHICHILKFVPS